MTPWGRLGVILNTNKQYDLNNVERDINNDERDIKHQIIIIITKFSYSFSRSDHMVTKYVGGGVVSVFSESKFLVEIIFPF